MFYFVFIDSLGLDIVWCIIFCVSTPLLGNSDVESTLQGSYLVFVQGLKFIGFNLKNGSTYKFTFDLAVESMGSTDFFELLFADGTAEKVSHGLASYVKIGESVNVSFEVTLKADATEFLMGCWSGDAIYTLDNLVIENVTK